MTFARSITLWCDSCGDTMDQGDLGTRTVDEARQFARACGAHVSLPGGRDICADCWAKGER